MVQIRAGFLSVTGNVRQNNEDNFYADPLGRFFIVADGMGGQSAGEYASKIAVEVIPDMFHDSIRFDSDASPEEIVRLIDAAVAEANRQIMEQGDAHLDLRKMGTTVVFLLAFGGQFFVGGVGDSRAYRLHDGEFQLLTTDHSLTQALLDAGTITPEEAEHHKYRNMLYRYLGCKDGGTGTNAQPHSPQPGDRYLLCTDGVSDGIKEQQIKQLLSEINDPQAAAEAIVQAALDGGSKDNVTCIVIHTS
jgi:serine/threonine protein phosphatase PrpC